jgi:uncharacterized protein YcnI
MIRDWRTAVVGLGAAVVGAVAFAAPAAADVTVTPSEALQGGPAELAFHVPEEHPGAYTTKIELVPPEATPIAEIYPMSVDGWAPITTTRKLDRPAELIHGTSTTEVPSSITWIRSAGSAPSPGQPAVLTVSLGPMPQGDRVAFTIVQTYSDGTVVRWADQPAAGGAQPKNAAPIVTLIDPGPAGISHGGTSHGGDDAAAHAAPAAQTDKSGGNGTYGILGAGLLVGLVAGLGLDGWIILRAVRRTSRAAAGSSLASPQ